MKPLPYAEFRKLDVNHIAHHAQRNNSVENLEVITACHLPGTPPERHLCGGALKTRKL